MHQYHLLSIFDVQMVSEAVKADIVSQAEDSFGSFGTFIWYSSIGFVFPE